MRFTRGGWDRRNWSGARHGASWQVLDVGGHDGTTDIILLDRVVRTESEQRCRRSVTRQTSHTLDSRDRVIRNMLRPHVPCPCFT
jgi:hypothetical protein